MLYSLIFIIFLILFYLEFIAEKKLDNGFTTIRFKNGIEKRYANHHIKIYGWGIPEQFGEKQLGISGSLRTNDHQIYDQVKHLLGNSTVKNESDTIIIEFEVHDLKFETNEFKSFLSELDSLLN